MTDTIPTSASFDPSNLDDLISKQDELRRAKEEAAGPIPIIDDSPEVIVTLPRGLFHGGTWQRTVEVRELTGADEEALAKARDPADSYDAVIGHGVVRVGDQDLTTITPVERGVLMRQLLIGERDMVFLGIVRAAYGEERRLPMVCQVCEHEQEMVLKLSEDFKPKIPEDADGTSFHVFTSKGHNIEYRPATGVDQRQIMDRRGSTVAEENTQLLASCITNVNGGLVVDPEAFARDLPIRDRRTILRALMQRQPTIDLTVTLPCLDCGRENTVALTWADLFRAE